MGAGVAFSFGDKAPLVISVLEGVRVVFNRGTLILSLRERRPAVQPPSKRTHKRIGRRHFIREPLYD
jgi:hypothetical protein